MQSSIKDSTLNSMQFRAVIVMIAVLVLPAVALAGSPAKLALTGARIITVSGDDIRNGTVLIENGKITAVGRDVSVPYDAMEVDCSGKVLFPGMIDPHSARGLDVANESRDVTPYVDVYDAIDPSRVYFEESLRRGVTSVHVMVSNNCVVGGKSRVVRPIGRTPDDMTVRAEVGLKLSTSPKGGYDRMLQLQSLRSTFSELDHYLERVAERRYEEKLKEDDKPLTVGPEEARKRGKELVRDEDLDDTHRALDGLRKGRLSAWIHAGSAMDVRPAVDIATKQGFLDDSVFVIGVDTVRAIGELKAAKRPIVVPVDMVRRNRDPITGDVTEEFVPAALHAAGLTFALQPSPNSSMAERFLNYQAARCVRHGIPRRVALKSITLNPANMLGLGDQLGSIEVGKIANIVVFSADPLDFNAKIEQVFIDGILAYERSRDPRIQDLLPKPKVEALAPTEESTEEGAKSESEGDADGKKSEAKSSETPPKGDGTPNAPAGGGSGQ